MKNRGQLIEIFISNLANSIVHQILERSTNEQVYIDRYDKEMKNSWQLAKSYREKINPSDKVLPLGDIEDTKRKIVNKVNSDLKLRIDRGYEHIDLTLVEEFVSNALKELKVSE